MVPHNSSGRGFLAGTGLRKSSESRVGTIPKNQRIEYYRANDRSRNCYEHRAAGLGGSRRREIAGLDDALIDHGVGHFAETGDVGTEHQIAGCAVLLGGFAGGAVDVLHNPLELGVNFLESPL